MRREVIRMRREVIRTRRRVIRTRREVVRMRREVVRTRRLVRRKRDWSLHTRGRRRGRRGGLADEMENLRASAACHCVEPARPCRNAATQLQHAATTIQQASEAFPDVTAAWNRLGLLGVRASQPLPRALRRWRERAFVRLAERLSRQSNSDRPLSSDAATPRIARKTNHLHENTASTPQSP